MLMRATQAMLGSDKARLSCYVDDPILVLSDDKIANQKNIALLIMLWRSVGFPLSFKKRQLGSTVTWTSARLTVSRTSLDVAIKEELVKESITLVESFLQSNVASIKRLRRLAGKLSHISSIVTVIKPVADPLWAALSQQAAGSAPKNCVWTRQIHYSLTWLRAFLRGLAGQLLRTYTVEEYYGTNGDCLICTDASTTGIGGFLATNGCITDYYHDALSADDYRILGQTSDDSKGQQVFEVLAILVSMRLWANKWADRRIRLTVRSDSVSALTLLLRFKSGPTTSVIAREIAYDVALSLYQPTVAQHVAGVVNTTCDLLSRWSNDSQLPACLRQANLCQPPVRSESYYKTLHACC